MDENQRFEVFSPVTNDKLKISLEFYMSSKANFKQLTLVHSMHLIFKMQSFPKLICSTFLITSCISAACAQEQLTDTSNNKTVDQQSLNQVKSDQSTEDTSTVLSSNA